MKEQRKPLSTKKPPAPMENHDIIEDWLENRVMPGIQPLVRRIDELITERIPNLEYAIKWGNAYYGSQDLGWLIELAAYDVSVNVVFLSGTQFDLIPPLGTDERSRYIKLRTIDDLIELKVTQYIEQAGLFEGWR